MTTPPFGNPDNMPAIPRIPIPRPRTSPEQLPPIPPQRTGPRPPRRPGGGGQ